MSNETKSGGGCSKHGPFEVCGHDDSSCPDKLNKKERKKIEYRIDEINTLEELITRHVNDDIDTGVISKDNEAKQRAMYEEQIRDNTDPEQSEIYKNILNAINNGEMKMFAAYDDNNALLADGSIELRSTNHGKRGFIFADFTRPNYRGQSIMSELTDKRIEWAKNQPDCTGVDAEVKATNPIGLATKFKSGFRAVNIRIREDDKKLIFDISRDFDNGNDKHEKPQSNPTQEVPFDDTTTIAALLKDGVWEGIGIRSIGKKDDNSPANWILKLQETSRT